MSKIQDELREAIGAYAEEMLDGPIHMGCPATWPCLDAIINRCVDARALELACESMASDVDELMPQYWIEQAEKEDGK